MALRQSLLILFKNGVEGEFADKHVMLSSIGIQCSKHFRNSSQFYVILCFSFSFSDKRAPLYNSLPVTPMITDDDQPLIDVLPLSMRRIESAWQDEVITTKRERGL